MDKAKDPEISTLSKMEALALTEIFSELEQELEACRKKEKRVPVPFHTLPVEDPLTFLKDIITRTNKEIRDEGKFRSLIEAVKEGNGNGEEEIEIIQNGIKKKKEKVSDLERELRRLEKDVREREGQQLCTIQGLKDDIHLTSIKLKEDTTFSQTWLKARNANALTAQKAEVGKVKEEISNMTKCLDKDCTAYENVAAFTKIRCLKMERTIKKWKEKKAKDELYLQELIGEKKDHILTQEKTIEELQTLIEQRIEELIPWEEEKEQERQERIVHMRRYYSCRKIQRWWKAKMVQHGLYKKPKGKAIKGKPVKEKAKSLSKSPKSSKSN